MAHTKNCIAGGLTTLVESLRNVAGLSADGFIAVVRDFTDHPDDYLTDLCKCSPVRDSHEYPQRQDIDPQWASDPSVTVVSEDETIKLCGCYADDSLCPHEAERRVLVEIAREDEDPTYDPDDPASCDRD